MVRWIFALCVLPLFTATFCAAEEPAVRCFLVDSRVHVALVPRESGAGGEICWHDTVTGATGQAPFVQDGSRLVLTTPEGQTSEAHLLPHLAIVLRNPPWEKRESRLALGVALD